MQFQINRRRVNNSVASTSLGSFTINCDAVVRRDCGGYVVAAGTKLEVKTSVNLAEAKTTRWAMSMVQLLKLRKLKGERDSKICFDALCKATTREYDHIEPWELRIVLEDVPVMAKEMDQVKFKWARREANEAAHVLANHGLVNN